MLPSPTVMWSVLALLLALSGGAMSLDKLNICMDAKHHKTEPGPEGQLYQQVIIANIALSLTFPFLSWFKPQGAWWKKHFFSSKSIKWFWFPFSSALHGEIMHAAQPTPLQKPMTMPPISTTSTGITVVLWARSAKNISSRTLVFMSAHHTWDPGYNQWVFSSTCAFECLMFVYIFVTRWQHRKLKGQKWSVVQTDETEYIYIYIY